MAHFPARIKRSRRDRHVRFPPFADRPLPTHCGHWIDRLFPGELDNCCSPQLLTIVNRDVSRDNRAVKKPALVFALAAVSSSAPAQHAAGDRAAELRCDIAGAYIESLLSEPGMRASVFSTESLYPLVPDGYPQHWGSVDGESAASSPPPGLAETLPAGSNAVRSCASIQRSLTRLGRRFGRGAVAWARHVRRGGYLRARIVTVSLPAMSADGEHAVLVASNSRGRLDGGEAWVHMERGRDGRWRATGVTALWVS